MFTGIIEATGTVAQITSEGTNRSFVVSSALSASFKIDQSVSHNGVCLTIENTKNDSHRVTAIAETLERSNLGHLKVGSLINLEQCLSLNSRLDGHLVQGHVDTRGTCIGIKDLGGSWEIEIEIPKKFSPLIIEKGSICLNGISLTVFNVKKKKFTVAIVPYTFEHTNIRQLMVGESVNLEFDVIGKYLLRSLSLSKDL